MKPLKRRSEAKPRSTVTPDLEEQSSRSSKEFKVLGLLQIVEHLVQAWYRLKNRGS